MFSLIGFSLSRKSSNHFPLELVSQDQQQSFCESYMIRPVHGREIRATTVSNAAPPRGQFFVDSYTHWLEGRDVKP